MKYFSVSDVKFISATLAKNVSFRGSSVPDPLLCYLARDTCYVPTSDIEGWPTGRHFELQNSLEDDGQDEED